MVLRTPGFLAMESRSAAAGVSALQISVRPRSRLPVAIATFFSRIRLEQTPEPCACVPAGCAAALGTLLVSVRRGVEEAPYTVGSFLGGRDQVADTGSTRVVSVVDLESKGRGVILVRMMPDLILSIDSSSDGRYSPVPLRPR